MFVTKYTPYLRPNLLFILALGFSSGLPLALTASTLTAWLSDTGVDKTAIGLFAAIATPYSIKFLWAPLVDGFHLPFFHARFGARRGWILLTQFLLAVSIAAMAFADPAGNAWMTALLGVVVATFSATQDIAIDAYRVESLSPEDQGRGAAMSTLGYRIGMLVSGAGALMLADAVGWQGTYLLMAGVMGGCLCITASAGARLSSEALAKGEASHEPPKVRPDAFAGANAGDMIKNHLLAPFVDFMTRPGWLGVLAFVVLYKLGDAFLGAMLNPFLLEIGFTKTQIAAVVKVYGLGATLAGTFIGGSLVARYGTFRTLLAAGFFHMLTNLLMVAQARVGADTGFLAFSIMLENATNGMSLAALVAYLSGLCSLRYTATQYALLSSFAAFARTWLSTPSGWVAKTLGWEGFFILATALALPSLGLLVWLQRRYGK